MIEDLWYPFVNVPLTLFFILMSKQQNKEENMTSLSSFTQKLNYFTLAKLIPWFCFALG
jgi:hypothetical protein